MDVHTKEQRSYNMSRVKSKNTRPEKILFSEFKKAGYKFKKHFNLHGKPDMVFPRYKIAVFIDGEFWHGKDFTEWEQRISDFWRKKIGDNIKRDRSNDRKLRKTGWHVVHVWGRRLMRNPHLTLHRITKFIDKHRNMPD